MGINGWDKNCTYIINLIVSTFPFFRPGSEIIDSNNKASFNTCLLNFPNHLCNFLQVDIVLEPILDSPITPLRRRRFQRLIIDKETTIDIETFKAQLDEFANTLRCKVSSIS